MCLIGEMKRDHTWWQRAWDESNGRCAKAMRNLGRHYFFENKYQESIECFEKSLELNKLYPDIWFTLGCAYMHIKDYK
jgi:tetratricopeptide (TPR) repeat protein